MKGGINGEGKRAHLQNNGGLCQAVRIILQGYAANVTAISARKCHGYIPNEGSRFWEREKPPMQASFGEMM